MTQRPQGWLPFGAHASSKSDHTRCPPPGRNREPESGAGRLFGAHFRTSARSSHHRPRKWPHRAKALRLQRGRRRPVDLRTAAREGCASRALERGTRHTSETVYALAIEPARLRGLGTGMLAPESRGDQRHVARVDDRARTSPHVQRYPSRLAEGVYTLAVELGQDGDRRHALAEQRGLRIRRATPPAEHPDVAWSTLGLAMEAPASNDTRLTLQLRARRGRNPPHALFGVMDMVALHCVR